VKPVRDGTGSSGVPDFNRPLAPDEVDAATWEGLPRQTGQTLPGPDLVVERAGLPGLPSAESRLNRRGDRRADR
jgi:hypothetical protein